MPKSNDKYVVTGYSRWAPERSWTHGAWCDDEQRALCVRLNKCCASTKHCDIKKCRLIKVQITGQAPETPKYFWVYNRRNKGRGVIAFNKDHAARIALRNHHVRTVFEARVYHTPKVSRYWVDRKILQRMLQRCQVGVINFDKQGRILFIDE